MITSVMYQMDYPWSTAANNIHFNAANEEILIDPSDIESVIVNIEKVLNVHLEIITTLKREKQNRIIVVIDRRVKRKSKRDELYCFIHHTAFHTHTYHIHHIHHTTHPPTKIHFCYTTPHPPHHHPTPSTLKIQFFYTRPHPPHLKPCSFTVEWKRINFNFFWV